MDKINELSQAAKNKLVNENVTESTLHFAKRTQKLMNLLENGGMFIHGGKDFKVDSHLYRVEFQARGAPHIHCLLWLEDDEGNKPPSMWNEENRSDAVLGDQIASFCDSIMSGCSADMNCDMHACLISTVMNVLLEKTWLKSISLTSIHFPVKRKAE